MYWEELGKTVGYDGLYKTESVAGEPKYLAFFDQLNVTYAPLEGVDMANRVAHAFVPNATVFPTQPQVVNTAFVALVDADLSVTVYNSSNLNKCVALFKSEAFPWSILTVHLPTATLSRSESTRRPKPILGSHLPRTFPSTSTPTTFRLSMPSTTCSPSRH